LFGDGGRKPGKGKSVRDAVERPDTDKKSGML